MTTRNTSHPVNTLPFLSEEMERTLRLRAWKDEKFREALIADPKGVIQRLFPQCFPNGKLPEELTLKVIEEDPGTCHIVIPPLPDEFPTPEIPEEEQLELLAYMGADRRLDSSDKRESQSPEKPNQRDFMRKHYEMKQETASKPNLQKDIESLAKKDGKFREKLKEVSNETSQEKKEGKIRNIINEYFPNSFSNDKVSEKQTFKVTQDTSDTRHLVLPKLPDTSLDTTLPKHEQFGGQSGDVTCVATSCGCQTTYNCK